MPPLHTSHSSLHTSPALASLIYRLRNRGFRIDTRARTVYIDSADVSDLSPLRRLRDEFHFHIQTECGAATTRARVYISGPIAHYDLDERKRVFREAEQRLRREDYIPVNPFNNGLPQPGDWREHMRADMRMLLASQYIVFLPDWQLSKGCKLELDVATSCGIRVLSFTF